MIILILILVSILNHCSQEVRYHGRRGEEGDVIQYICYFI